LSITVDGYSVSVRSASTTWRANWTVTWWGYGLSPSGSKTFPGISHGICCMECPWWQGIKCKYVVWQARVADIWTRSY